MARREVLDTRRDYSLSIPQTLKLYSGWKKPETEFEIDRECAPYSFRIEDDVKKSWYYHRETNPIFYIWAEPEDLRFGTQAGRRPWAWWHFDAPEPRDYSIHEEDQLLNLGLLTKHEIPIVEARMLRKKKFFSEHLPFFLESMKVPNVKKSYDIGDHVLFPNDEVGVKEGCTFDIFAANHVCDFMELYCRQSKGQWAGKYMRVMDWTRYMFLYPIFGWKREDGTRRVKRAYCEIAKKNGKSTTMSALETYGVIADGEGGPEVYTAAVARKQAGIVHKEASSMVRKSQELFDALKPVDSQNRIDVIGDNGSSFIQALASEAGSVEGVNAHYLIKDELHAWKDNAFLGAIQYSMRVRRQPLDMSITTAGDVLESIGGQAHQYAKEVLNGSKVNTTRHDLIFGNDNDADIEDPMTWLRANPSLGDIITEDQIKEDLAEAMDKSESDLAKFKRYILNIWVSELKPWLPMRYWPTNVSKLSISELEDSLKGQPCFMGLDLSKKSDISALTLAFPVPDERKFKVLRRLFVPESQVKIQTDRGIDYYDWVAKGHLITSPGEYIDNEAIFNQISDDAEKFDVQAVAFDPWGSTEIMQKLEDGGLNVIEYRQGYKTMSPATLSFKNLLLENRLEIPNCPCLRWQAGNVIVVEDDQENVKPSKKKANGKIDAIVSMIMALDLAQKLEVKHRIKKYKLFIS